MAPTQSGGEPPDSDRLIRQRAGTYRTTDERFEVQQSATGWFVVDAQTTNEFGQPVMLGPFATLEAVRVELPNARKVTPMRPTKPPAVSKRQATAPNKPAPSPAPPAQNWIDKLPSADASRIRALIRQLEREGVERAESVVRADRDGPLPAVATQLIERRLKALVDELPPGERSQAREIVLRAAEVLTVDGSAVRAPLPKWALVEIGSAGEPANRRIVLRRKP